MAAARPVAAAAAATAAVAALFGAYYLGREKKVHSGIRETKRQLYDRLKARVEVSVGVSVRVLCVCVNTHTHTLHTYTLLIQRCRNVII